MPDNLGYTPGSGAKVTTRDVTYSGEAAQLQVVGLATVEGPDDAKTVQDVSSTAPLPTQEIPQASSLLLRIFNLLTSPMGFDRSLSRQRVTGVIESGTVTTVSTVTTVTTVTTVATVSGLTNIDGRNGAMLINQTNLSAWADCHRARIT